MKGLSKYENFKTVHPLPEGVQLSENDIPIIKNEVFEWNNLCNINIINGSNRTSCKNRNNTIVINFNYDDVLKKYWNNPFDYIPVFQTFYAVCTPDFSTYSNMNSNEIRFNVYRNRYLGCFWQYYGIKVIPTIQWGNEDTFKYCFDGVEEGAVVAISTIGCYNYTENFMKGFNELKRRIKPKLIIVYGKIIEGMTGTFLQFNYEDAFNKNKQKYKQLSFFTQNKLIKINERGDVDYGW